MAQLARLGVPIDNLCGPTEVTIDTTRWVCVPGQDPHRVPLGRPIANSRLYVVDPEMRLVPIGVAKDAKGEGPLRLTGFRTLGQFVDHMLGRG